MTRPPEVPTVAGAPAASRPALDRARQDLLAAFDAKRDADRRFLAAFAVYEATADACRSVIRARDTDPPAHRTGL